MLTSWSIGTPIHFGPHTLLSVADLNVIHRLLHCRRCCFRRLYHKLAAKEYRSLQHIKSNQNCIFSSIPPFHSLTRAIKAVLLGYNLNRRLPVNLCIETAKCTSLYFPSSADNCYITLFKTTFCTKPQFWLCPSHGREIFDLLYYDPNVQTEHVNSHLKLGIRPFIFKDRSDFIRTTELSDSSEDESDDSIVSLQIDFSSSLHIFNSEQNELLHNPICKLSSQRSELESLETRKRILAANHKWNLNYSDCSESNRPCVADKCVHFLSGNPVSAIYYLTTYAVASRLERCNRTWQSHYFDHIRMLMSTGHEFRSASELAFNADIDEETIDPSTLEDTLVLPIVTNSAIDTSSSSINHSSDTQLEANENIKTRRRRRKRHKNRRTKKTTPKGSPIPFPDDLFRDFVSGIIQDHPIACSLTNSQCITSTSIV